MGFLHADETLGCARELALKVFGIPVYERGTLEGSSQQQRNTEISSVVLQVCKRAGSRADPKHKSPNG